MAPGTCQPVADTVRPATDPIVIGLRSGAVAVRSRDRAPVTCSRAAARSSTVVKTGAMTASWNSSTGATIEASPNTYSAIGMPRLPALT